MITSNPSMRLRRKIAEAGANLVEKPLLCDSLVNAIEGLLVPSRDAGL